jgi:predicted sulfurtransferase
MERGTPKQSARRFLNLAAYRFVALAADELVELRAILKAECEARDFRGTILLSTEGINLALSGAPEMLRSFAHWLGEEDARFADLSFKESYSDHQPFRRMLVKTKREIIAFGVLGLSPEHATAPHLAPATLKSWLDEGRDLVLFDARNDYEIRLGTFRGACDLSISTFRSFPERRARLDELHRDRTVVTFCTGGIRCEKASALLMKDGFTNVYQLDGGILRYFEECGDAHYDGECFVYDRRVSLDSDLQETRTVQCFNCLAPVSVEEQELPTYVPDVSCPACVHGKPARASTAATS